MCVVSNIGTDWSKTVPDTHPWTAPYTKPNPPVAPFPPNGVSYEEFNALRKEMEELKLLLRAAKRFDIETGQAECSQEEKVALIRRLAELVGVDMEDVFDGN